MRGPQQDSRVGPRRNEESASTYALAIFTLLQQVNTLNHSLSTGVSRSCCCPLPSIGVVRPTKGPKAPQNSPDNRQTTYRSAVSSTLINKFTRWFSKYHDPTRSSQSVQPGHKYSFRPTTCLVRLRRYRLDLQPTISDNILQPKPLHRQSMDSSQSSTLSSLTRCHRVTKIESAIAPWPSSTSRNTLPCHCSLPRNSVFERMMQANISPASTWLLLCEFRDIGSPAQSLSEQPTKSTVTR